MWLPLLAQWAIPRYGLAPFAQDVTKLGEAPQLAQDIESVILVVKAADEEEMSNEEWSQLKSILKELDADDAAEKDTLQTLLVTSKPHGPVILAQAIESMQFIIAHENDRKNLVP